MWEIITYKLIYNCKLAHNRIWASSYRMLKINPANRHNNPKIPRIPNFPNSSGTNKAVHWRRSTPNTQDQGSHTNISYVTSSGRVISTYRSYRTATKSHSCTSRRFPATLRYSWSVVELNWSGLTTRVLPKFGIARRREIVVEYIQQWNKYNWEGSWICNVCGEVKEETLIKYVQTYAIIVIYVRLFEPRYL